MYAECYVKPTRSMGIAGAVSTSAREGNHTVEQEIWEGTPNQPEVWDQWSALQNILAAMPLSSRKAILIAFYR